MAGGDGGAEGEDGAVKLNPRSGGQVTPGDGDGVARVEADGKGG